MKTLCWREGVDTAVIFGRCTLDSCGRLAGHRHECDSYHFSWLAGFLSQVRFSLNTQTTGTGYKYWTLLVSRVFVPRMIPTELPGQAVGGAGRWLPVQGRHLVRIPSVNVKFSLSCFS